MGCLNSKDAVEIEEPKYIALDDCGVEKSEFGCVLDIITPSIKEEITHDLTVSIEKNEPIHSPNHVEISNDEDATSLKKILEKTGFASRITQSFRNHTRKKEKKTRVILGEIHSTTDSPARFHSSLPSEDNTVSSKVFIPFTNLDQFKEMLLAGFEVRKHSRRGKSKPLWIWCNENFDELLWNSNKGKHLTLTHKSFQTSPSLNKTTNIYHFNLKSVTVVVAGNGSFKQKRRSVKENQDRCLSLVSKKRSLDLECPSHEMREAMIMGFNDLLGIDTIYNIEIKEV